MDPELSLISEAPKGYTTRIAAITILKAKTRGGDKKDVGSERETAMNEKKRVK